MIRVHYSCPDVGEYWEVGYFHTMEEAIRHVEENCVDERNGHGCFFDDFHFDVIEEDLKTVDMNKPRFNPNYSKHRKDFTGIITCKICSKKLNPNEIEYSNSFSTDTIIAHEQCIKDKKFGKQFSEYQEITK